MNFFLLHLFEIDAVTEWIIGFVSQSMHILFLYKFYIQIQGKFDSSLKMLETRRCDSKLNSQKRSWLAERSWARGVFDTLVWQLFQWYQIHPNPVCGYNNSSVSVLLGFSGGFFFFFRCFGFFIFFFLVDCRGNT